MRRGDWKLHRIFADNDDGSDRFELYNLRDDLGETKNLAAERPELARELNGLITDFLRETEAVIPVRNPKYDPNARAKAAAADPLQGWKARNCDAVVKDGIVTVTGKNGSPFLGVAAGQSIGPAVASVRIRCAHGGNGKIEWIPPGKTQADAESVPFTLPSGDWHDVTVNVPAQGPLGIFRIYLPAEKQLVEIDRIELKSRGKPRRWDF